MDDDELARLEAAGLVAPIVRGMDERTLRRRVHTYDRETGAPVRDVTVRELVGGLAKVTALEVEVIEGRRPEAVRCERCSKPVAVHLTGKLPRVCHSAVGGCGRQTQCAGGCGRKPHAKAFSSSSVLSRDGAPWTCRPCMCSETSRKAAMSLSPEQRSARARKGNESRTPEQRANSARKARASQNAEQQAELAKKGAAASWAKLTPEQRSEKARKASEARWAKRSEEKP